ncbi:transposase [Aquabacterium sp. A7-Y]|uniref:transposase n=1 Tax=Aquabacterium sp. A7-Y TaxID=1349605 RepID=UPI00223CCB3C|nr:transposase [Aquabacterium sp. A7-Y]MCW7540063.1 transposase [Aquabacterium sp. A7-Y]
MPEALKSRLQVAQRLHAQQRDSKDKLYALHAPELEYLAKGKARTLYEFGVKVSVAVTAREGLVVGMRSMPGNPYDGHTLDSQLEQVEILTEQRPKIVLADRGYRGAQPPAGSRLLLSHTRRLPRALKRLLKRRQVVEPMIGHMKSDGLLARNWLKGEVDDALNSSTRHISRLCCFLRTAAGFSTDTRSVTWRAPATLIIAARIKDAGINDDARPILHQNSKSWICPI